MDVSTMKLHPKQKTVPRGKVKNKEVRSYKFIGTDQAEEVNKYLNQPGLPLDDKVLALVELTRDYERGQLWKGQEIVDHINKTIAELKIGRAESHAFNLAEGGFTVKELPTGNPSKTALWWAYTRAVDCSDASASALDRPACTGFSRCCPSKPFTLIPAGPRQLPAIPSSANAGKNICSSYERARRREGSEMSLYKKSAK
jgi:hypothetical protein